jgi:hypothetical protein
MNDLKYRFIDREQVRMKGYTSFINKWTFMDQTDDVEFDVTFVHEIFHAMSAFYGVKNRYEEESAKNFTESLGLGK